LELPEDELVRLEEVLGFARVLPPALDPLDADPVSVGEERLDGVRDFELSSP
jgi:hypothetical protein